MLPVNDSEGSYALYCLARLLLEAGSFGEAMPVFEDSLKLAAHFKAHEGLGECLLRLGDAEAAIPSLSAAVDRNRGARPRVLLAEALVAVGRAREARLVLEEALALHPGHGPARRWLHAIRKIHVQ